MVLDCGHRSAAFHQPDPCRPVVGTRQSMLAVLTEYSTAERSVVSTKNGNLGTGRGVPNADGVIPRGRNDALAIGAEAGICDPFSVTLQDWSRRTGRGMPKPCSEIIRHCHNVLAV